MPYYNAMSFKRIKVLLRATTIGKNELHRDFIWLSSKSKKGRAILGNSKLAPEAKGWLSSDNKNKITYYVYTPGMHDANS